MLRSPKCPICFVSNPEPPTMVEKSAEKIMDMFVPSGHIARKMMGNQKAYGRWFVCPVCKVTLLFGD